MAITLETLAPIALLNTWLSVAVESTGSDEASNFRSCWVAFGVVPVAATALVMPELWPT